MSQGGLKSVTVTKLGGRVFVMDSKSAFPVEDISEVTFIGKPEWDKDCGESIFTISAPKRYIRMKSSVATASGFDCTDLESFMTSFHKKVEEVGGDAQEIGAKAQDSEVSGRGRERVRERN